MVNLRIVKNSKDRLKFDKSKASLLNKKLHSDRFKSNINVVVDTTATLRFSLNPNDTRRKTFVMNSNISI